MNAVALTRRSRLYRAFKPIVDGLFDKARNDAAIHAAVMETVEPINGQWAKSQPWSYDIEIIENMTGNPLNLLGRAIDGVHRGELKSVALVAIGEHGVIHSAWSSGDLETMSKAAGFLAGDLQRASER